MKILITGAHFTPAQAVIEELQKNHRIELVYVGRKSTREGDKTPSPESQILPRLGVKYIPLTTGRLQRSFTPYTIPSLLKIPVGFLQAFYFLLKERPDVVLSFGGYVAVPVVVAAWLLSIPIIIHEQTLVSGLANRISAVFANKIALTLKENDLASYKNTVLTGNPIRKELIDTDMSQVGADIKNIGLPLVLIVGGNQGSHTINQAVGEVLDELTKVVYIVHQTGDSSFRDFERLEPKSSDRYLARKWINGSEMGYLLRKSSLVVCRAGMNTLLEACYFEKPLLVIPIPVKEQTLNAKYFQKLGNARVLWQKDLTGKNLLQAIFEALKITPQETKDLIIPDAAKRLALETLLLVKE